MLLDDFPHSSYINGQWYSSPNEKGVFNPATQHMITSVSLVNIGQAEEAIDAAYNAFHFWSAMSAHERADLLHKWHDLIVEHCDELACILTLEQGKPLAEAVAEIKYSASFLLWFAEEAKRAYGDVIPSPNRHQQFIVLKQPVGVVTAITPWNFPSAMIMRKASAALAAGCSFVVKPDIQTPLSALALAHLSKKAGIPDGVFNVLVSDQAQVVGEMFTEHEKVAKFTFTGSTDVGKMLLKQCASTVKKVTMELGGNAPLIVFEDADIASAVDGAISAKFRNAGQTCICVNRIYVHESIQTQFIEAFVDKVTQLIVDDGMKSKVDIGPLINKEAVEKMQELVNAAVSEGANVVLGGNKHPLGENYYQPTILTHVTETMAVVSQEVFGPIASIMTFHHEDEVIELANGTKSGLAAYFYSENMKRVWRVGQRLSFGMVGINDTAISNAFTPFGGVKESGYGREGSKYGLDDYLYLKYLCISQ